MIGFTFNRYASQAYRDWIFSFSFLRLNQSVSSFLHDRSHSLNKSIYSCSEMLKGGAFHSELFIIPNRESIIFCNQRISKLPTLPWMFYYDTFQPWPEHCKMRLPIDYTKPLICTRYALLSHLENKKPIGAISNLWLFLGEPWLPLQCLMIISNWLKSMSFYGVFCKSEFSFILAGWWLVLFITSFTNPFE